MSQLNNSGLFDLMIECISSLPPISMTSLSGYMVPPKHKMDHTGWTCDYCKRYNMSVNGLNCVGCGAGYVTETRKVINVDIGKIDKSYSWYW